MPEYLDDGLPAGLSVDDLRYTRLNPDEIGKLDLYAPKKGWHVSIQEGTEESPHKAHYVLVKEVPPTFDHGDLLALQDNIGITDTDGEIYEDYSLFLHRLGEVVEYDDDFPFAFTAQTNRLIFDFKGFPTNHTMDTLAALVEYTPPKPPGRWTRLLGYLGLNNTYMSD